MPFGTFLHASSPCSWRLPKRGATDIWSGLQCEIENCLITNSPALGAVTDVQKVFNCLPRPLVRNLLVASRIPAALADAWISLLHQLKRSVIIGGAYSDPHPSFRGISEGCPFSVVAAALVGAWLTFKIRDSSACRRIVYVDNWEVVSRTPEDLAQGISIISDFSDAWDPKLDFNKSWVWTSRDPTPLKSFPFPRSLDERDLGAFIRYKNTGKLGLLSNRLDGCLRRIQKVESLPISQLTKAHLIQGSAYSTGFYGSEVRNLPTHGSVQFGPFTLHCRRSGLSDLTLPDVDLTNKLVGDLPDGDKQLVEIHLSGGITTRAQASIWSDGDAICPYCLDRDTIPHRVLTCSGVAHIREAFPELSRLPPDLAKCPWVPMGDHIEGWRRLVSSRPYPIFPSPLFPDGGIFCIHRRKCFQ